jgi:hypothetical protein
MEESGFIIHEHTPAGCKLTCRFCGFKNWSVHWCSGSNSLMHECYAEDGQSVLRYQVTSVTVHDVVIPLSRRI